MSYTYNKEEYELLKDGEYECVVDNIRIAETTTGKEYINLTFKIRDDIEQEYQGRLIFESIWKEKDSDYFNRKRLNKILQTQAEIGYVKEGQEFKDIEDVLDTIAGSFLICVVGKRMNDYVGREENFIRYYKKTEHQLTGMVQDEELPF